MVLIGKKCFILMALMKITKRQIPNSFGIESILFTSLPTPCIMTWEEILTIAFGQPMIS